MSFIWTYNNEPVTFNGRVATFGGPALTTYGHDEVTVGPWLDESRFNTATDEQLSLVTTDVFTLTEATNFAAMSAGAKINNDTSGLADFILWNSVSGTPTTMVAIIENVVIPDTSAGNVPVLVTADITGIAEFQNVPPGEYSLSVQGTTEGIILASTTINTGNPFCPKGDHTPDVGDSWIADGQNQGRVVIWIEGSPVGGQKSAIGSAIGSLTRSVIGKLIG